MKKRKKKESENRNKAGVTQVTCVARTTHYHNCGLRSVILFAATAKPHTIEKFISGLKHFGIHTSLTPSPTYTAIKPTIHTHTQSHSTHQTDFRLPFVAFVVIARTHRHRGRRHHRSYVVLSRRTKAKMQNVITFVRLPACASIW